MRTTVRLPESLLAKARAEAARRGTTLTALLEQGLRMALSSPRRGASESTRISLPVCRKAGGTLPGVDLNDTSSLLDRMEDRR